LYLITWGENGTFLNIMPSKTFQLIVFLIALLFCATPLSSPPIALAVGLAIALTVGHPFASQNHRATKILLQCSVVGLGFGIDLGKVLEAGKTGITFTIFSIAATLALGFIAGKFLKVDRRISHLISSGTAICGGSAIAAVGPVLDASEKEMSVALGTVFILNSVALFLFPVIGHYFNFTQQQFGLWAAIAIHDTSSVVGAAAKYGTGALQVAVPVKLARTLWIIPLTFATSVAFKKSSAKITIPYFVFLFLLASVVRTYVAPLAAASDILVTAAKTGLAVTLFLIGAGLSKSVLKSVGVRPLVLGVILWAAISVGAFLVVMKVG